MPVLECGRGSGAVRDGVPRSSDTNGPPCAGAHTYEYMPWPMAPCIDRVYSTSVSQAASDPSQRAVPKSARPDSSLELPVIERSKPPGPKSPGSKPPGFKWSSRSSSDPSHRAIQVARISVIERSKPPGFKWSSQSSYLDWIKWRNQVELPIKPTGDPPDPPRAPTAGIQES